MRRYLCTWSDLTQPKRQFQGEIRSRFVPMHILTIQRWTHSRPLMKANRERAVTSGRLTRGDGDRAMLPMEALSSSTEGAVTTWSAGRGFILILNFFLWSSSSSDSSEEKKADFLVVGSSAVLRKVKLPFLNSHGFTLHLTWILRQSLCVGYRTVSVYLC